MTLQRILRAEIPPQARVCFADIFSWSCVSVHHTAVQQPLVQCLLMPGPGYVYVMVGNVYFNLTFM